MSDNPLGMIPPGSRDTPGSLQTVQLFWVALFAAVLVYGAIAWLVAGESVSPVGQRLEDWLRNPVALALYLLGVADFILAFVIPRMIPRLRPRAEAPAPTAAPSAFAIPHEVTTALIVRYAMLETAAILGLVAALLLRDWRLYLGLGGLSLVGFLLSFPSERLVRSFDETLRQA